MRWTLLDLIAVASAALLSLAIAGYRGWQHYEMEMAAHLVTDNILAVARTVDEYHAQTGRWFPPGESAAPVVKIYPDPFNADAKPYQGLDIKRLRRENNAGMVMQLVQFQPKRDRSLPLHLFEVPYLPDQPYLRILLDYGSRGQVETEILMRVQEKLPESILGEIDDHYYVVDLRRLLSAE